MVRMCLSLVQLLRSVVAMWRRHVHCAELMAGHYWIGIFDVSLLYYVDEYGSGMRTCAQIFFIIIC